VRAAIRLAAVRILACSALAACATLAVTVLATATRASAARAITPIASSAAVSDRELREWLTTDKLPPVRSVLDNEVNVTTGKISGNDGLIGRVITDGEESGDLLTIAASHGSERIVAFLLDRGAPVDGVENEWGHSPLYLAARGGHDAAVRALLAAGAHASRPDHAGSTPLHAAAAFGRLGAVRALIDAGIDVNEQSARGDTALKLAVMRHWDEVARFLLSVGARVDLADARGDTPLHESVRNDDAALARLLLSSGAHVRTNAYGRTPGDEARAWAPDLVPILPH
jgi:ankyrin repeat protein